MAVFFALVIKKPDKGEFEITDEALTLAEDEEFLQQSSSNRGEQRKKTILLPPDQARLIAMRAARMKERKMYSVIREVATYYVFLALLLTIAYTHRSPAAFFQTRNLVDTMGENFTKVSFLKGSFSRGGDPSLTGDKVLTFRKSGVDIFVFVSTGIPVISNMQRDQNCLERIGNNRLRKKKAQIKNRTVVYSMYHR